MLFEGDARDAHADWIGSITGDKDADRRFQGRVASTMERFKDQQRLVDAAAARCGYVMPQLTRQAVLLAVMKGLAPEGIDDVVQLLKAQSIIDRDNQKS